MTYIAMVPWMHWNPSLSIGEGFLDYQLMEEKKDQA